MLDATIREAVLFATDRGGPLGVATRSCAVS